MELIAPDCLPKMGINLSDSQRRRLEYAGKFPQRVQVSARSHAYVEAEIKDYVAERIAARPRVAA
jgi:prophage regulatory protein